MLTLKIMAIKDSKFLLLDEERDKLINIYFEFYKIDVKKGDEITLDERLISRNYEGYAQPYAFELVENSQYNKKKEVDFAMLKRGTTKMLLRRIYG